MDAKHKERALIVSDIHSNAHALRAVIDDATKALKGRKNFHASGLPFHEIWCVGDLVGYGPEPNEVIDMLRKFQKEGIAVHAVKGNHDTAVAGITNARDHMHTAAAQCAEHNASIITPENQRWLASLPDTAQVGPKIENPAGLTGSRSMFTLAHGTPDSPQGTYADSYESALYGLDHLDADHEHTPYTPHVIVGHTHDPRAFQFDPDHIVEHPAEDGSFPFLGPAANDYSLLHNDKLHILNNQGNGRFVINPGSVGQPRDHDPRASYGIAEVTASGIRIMHRRTPYDVPSVQKKMKAEGLPASMYQRLSLGR
ncbi:hypothetical protein EBS67_00020 [bacterium]|nr:hypothetical protein [bacterium]NBT60670.1 hypothetical protein [Planctomycetia bacterium]